MKCHRQSTRSSLHELNKTTTSNIIINAHLFYFAPERVQKVPRFCIILLGRVHQPLERAIIDVMLRPRRERLGIKSPAEFHHFPRVASARVSVLFSPTLTQSRTTTRFRNRALVRPLIRPSVDPRMERPTNDTRIDASRRTRRYTPARGPRDAGVRH